MDLTNINLIEDHLIITNDDGSITSIPEQDCTEDEQKIFDEFRSQYPNGKPIIMSLADLQIKKIDEVTTAYNNAVLDGFYSSANGTNILFDYNEESQAKFMKRLVRMNSNLITYPTMVPSKDNIPIQFTHDQLRQLFKDIEVFETGLETKLYALKTKINEAQTVDQVNTITW